MFSAAVPHTNPLFFLISSPSDPQLHTVSQIRYSRYLSCSQEVMFYVNCVLVASFASRSLYQILAIFDVSTLPDVPLSVSDCLRGGFLFDASALVSTHTINPLHFFLLHPSSSQVDGDCPLIVFLFFELWDYIPTILLITTVTSRSVSDDTAAHRNL